MQGRMWSTNTEECFEIFEEIIYCPDNLDLQVNWCTLLVQHITLKKKISIGGKWREFPLACSVFRTYEHSKGFSC